jgi:hypothetical protein
MAAATTGPPAAAMAPRWAAASTPADLRPATAGPRREGGGQRRLRSAASPAVLLVALCSPQGPRLSDQGGLRLGTPPRRVSPSSSRQASPYSRPWAQHGEQQQQACSRAAAWRAACSACLLPARSLQRTYAAAPHGCAPSNRTPSRPAPAAPPPSGPRAISAPRPSAAPRPSSAPRSSPRFDPTEYVRQRREREDQRR